MGCYRNMLRVENPEPIAHKGAVRPDGSFRTCLWLFLILMVVRLVSAFIFRRDLSNDDCEVDRVAFALAGHLGFANPFKIPTGPTSVVAPVYPFILAGIYELLGKGSPAEAVRQIPSCGVTCLQFALLPALAAAANVAPRVGVLAALLGGLSPLGNWIETKATFETPYTALLLVILTLLTLLLLNLKQPSGGWAWFHGATWGFSLRLAPQLLPILFGYLALGVLRFHTSEFRSYLRFSLILLFAATIVLTPWTIRNYYVFRRLMFVRGSFGLELSLSNNDSALPAFEQNHLTKGYQNIGPLVNLSAAQAVARLGESSYFNEQMHTAYRWIASNRRRFLRLTVERGGYFWFPPLEPHAKGIMSSMLTWCLTLTGIAGLFMMRQDHRWLALAIGVIWLTYPIVYYLEEFDQRYRYPIEWTLLFAASYAVKTGWVQIRQGILRKEVSI